MHLAISKKTFFFFLVSCFTFYFLLLKPSFAQNIQQTQPQNPATSQYMTPNVNPDVPQNLHTYTQSVFLELGATALCHLIGTDITRADGKCLGIDPKNGKIGFVQGGGGLVGFMGNMISGTYNLPISSSQYIAYLSSNFGIAKPAYAQGIGFQGLEPVIKIWQAIRDVVYLFFVVVFIVIGLGIMFRIQIDPRTVMTIQNQIPKIIITLILVTFSFAIAGFLIDLMWVATYLAISLLSNVPRSGINLGQASLDLAGRNVLEFANSNVSLGDGGIFSIVGNATGAVSSVVSSILGGNNAHPEAASIIGIIGGIVGSILCLGFGPAWALCAAGGLAGGAILGNFTGQIVGGVAGIFVSIVLTIALLYALFRIWFALIKAYVYILLGVIFSPPWIMMGAIPTTQAGFGNWLRHMLAYLSVFPATVIMLLLAKILMSSFQGIQSGKNFIPPLVGNPGLPDVIGSLIGFGIILLTPELVEIIKEALKAPSFKYLAAVGRSIGVGTGFAPGSIQRAGSLGLTIGGLRNLSFLQNLPFIKGAKSTGVSSTDPAVR